jgi:hypothetical protein
MMPKLRHLLFILMTVFIGALSIHAQGAPAQIDVALADLSNRVGQTLSITTVANWSWAQEAYTSTALGCDGIEGTNGNYPGYQFTITYGGTTYDYRVSADSTLVVLCGQLDPNQPTPTPSPDEQYNNPLCTDVEPDDDYPYMRTRVMVGMDVEVSEGVLNLRDAPSPNANQLQQVPTDVPFRIDGGPVCTEEFVWWYVNVNGQLGYIAEGKEGEYFIEPKRPEQLPSRGAITTDNANQLQQLTSITGNFVPHVAWSSDSTSFLLPGAVGSDSIWVYDINQPILRPRIIESDETMTTIETRNNNTQAMFGTTDGAVHLWQIVPDPNFNITETLYLNTHQFNLSSIAFSPDGSKFVSSGQNALTNANVNKTWAAIVWDIQTVSQIAVLSGHEGLIRDIAWSPDGSTIVTGSEDGTIRFWNASTGEQLGMIATERPISSIQYSNSGQFIAVGLTSSNGQVLLLDANLYGQIAQYQVTSSGISSLAFSPDDSLLVVGGTDNVFAVYNAMTTQPITAYTVNDTVRNVSFSPEGSLIAIATDKPEVIFLGVPYISG